jgi:hypothetical protein
LHTVTLGQAAIIGEIGADGLLRAVRMLPDSSARIAGWRKKFSAAGPEGEKWASALVT